MISAVELRAVLGADAALQARVDSIHAACSARIVRYAPGAPDGVKTESLILYAAWIYQSGAQSRSVFPAEKTVRRSTCPARFCYPARKVCSVRGASRALGRVGNALAVAASRRGASQLLHRRRS